MLEDSQLGGNTALINGKLDGVWRNFSRSNNMIGLVAVKASVIGNYYEVGLPHLDQ